MSLPWVIGIGILMGALISSLASLYLDSCDWRHSQVGLDNLAIQVGTEDSAILDRLRMKNSQLKKLEVAHHPLHVCAKSPLPWVAASCTGPDQIAETAIRFLVQAAGIEARTRWFANGVRAGTEIVGIGRGGRLERLEFAPFQTATCMVCRLENQFKLTQRNIKHHLSSFEKERFLQVGVDLIGTSLTQIQKWNYKLTLGEGG